MENCNEIEEIIWDGDNTIWDWMAYAVPAYEAMCSTIAKIAGKSEDETAAAMKRFYTAVGTLENELLVQGLAAEGFFSHIPHFDLNKVVVEAKMAFSEIRNERLRVYDGIAEVMDEISNRGVRQRMITDAPGGQASRRLKRSGLDGYFSDIYAMPTAEIGDLPSSFMRHGLGLDNPKLHVLSAEKPNVDLEEILHRTRDNISRTVGIIGDNDRKDMELARLYDCLGIHARYGIARADLVKRLQRFAPAHVAMRNMQIGGSDGALAGRGRIVPVNSPREITGVLFGV